MLSTRSESPFLLSNSSTTGILEMEGSTPKRIEELPDRNHHTDAYAQEEEIRYQQTEILVMVIKDVDSVMICRAALAQMPKGEKHFANTVLCNTGLSNQPHCSYFQTKTGHFFTSSVSD